MKSSSSITSTLLTLQNENLDNPKRIAKIFNNYFGTIGKKTEVKIKHSDDNYTDCFTNKNSNSFLISPTGKEEIQLILSSLNISKATGPYGIQNCIKTA